jgi:hypothetical protein
VLWQTLAFTHMKNQYVIRRLRALWLQRCPAPNGPEFANGQHFAYLGTLPVHVLPTAQPPLRSSACSAPPPSLPLKPHLQHRLSPKQLIPPQVMFPTKTPETNTLRAILLLRSFGTDTTRVAAMWILKLLKYRAARASSHVAAATSASVPVSQVASLDNSQAASAAISELTTALDFVFDSLSDAGKSSSPFPWQRNGC